MKRFIPAALILLSAVPMLAGLVRLFGLSTGLGELEGHARFAADPVPAVLHIIGATSFATIGALQFSPSLRRRPWHRIAGRVLAPFGIGAALSGMWMALRWSPKEYDEPALMILRCVVATSMIAFILVSLNAVRRRYFVTHERWMTRAYALGAGAGTQFFTLMPFLLFESIRSAHSQTLLMGAGWLVNVAVAEWALQAKADALQRLQNLAAEVRTQANQGSMFV